MHVVNPNNTSNNRNEAFILLWIRTSQDPNLAPLIRGICKLALRSVDKLGEHL